MSLEMLVVLQIFGNKYNIFDKVKFWPDNVGKWKNQGITNLVTVHENVNQISWLYIQQLARCVTKIQKCPPAGGAKGKGRGSPNTVEFVNVYTEFPGNPFKSCWDISCLNQSSAIPSAESDKNLPNNNNLCKCIPISVYSPNAVYHYVACPWCFVSPYRPK